MSKPILFYDDTCPICSVFQNHLSHSTGDRLEFAAIGSDAKNFKYVDSTGTIFFGKRAIQRLIHDFPETSSSISVLPEKWQVQIVNKIVQVAGILRKARKRAETASKSGGGCGGCGSKL